MYTAGLLLSLFLAPLVIAGPLSSRGHDKGPGKDSSSPIVYFIRHGEKPDKGDGLSPQGVLRSQCLVNVFSATSSYDIQYIMAQKPDKDGGKQRPYDTVVPLAASLGIRIDTSCDRDDSKCVRKVVERYQGKGNILICWEHGELTNLVKELGDKKAPKYPDDNFYYIWTDPSPYDILTNIGSENCPGLDTGSSS